MQTLHGCRARFRRWVLGHEKQGRKEWNRMYPARREWVQLQQAQEGLASRDADIARLQGDLSQVGQREGENGMSIHSTCTVLADLCLGKGFLVPTASIRICICITAQPRCCKQMARSGCKPLSPVIGAAPMVPPTCWRLSVAQLWGAIHNLYYLWGLQSTLAWHGALAFYILSRHSHTTHHPYLYLLFVASHCARMGGALPEQGPCPAALTQLGVCLCLCAIICTPHRSSKL